MNNQLVHTTKKKTVFNHWIITAVLVPFIITRLFLVYVGWFSQYFAPGDSYFSQEYVNRGHQFSSTRALDIWGRWDTGWYFGIVQDGYFVAEDTSTIQGSIAFFPLYPTLIKLFSSVLPAHMINESTLLGISVLISNIALFISLIFLYAITKEILHKRETAEKAVLFLLAFPTAFFLSAAYTESLFLMLSLATFYFGIKRKWLYVGLFGLLASLSRSLGVLLFIPMAMEYGNSIKWNIRKIKPNVLWLLGIPLGLGLFFLYSYNLSGDFLAPLHAQSAWFRETVSPLTSLFDPVIYRDYLTLTEQCIVVASFGIIGLSFFLLPSKSFGTYALISALLPLFSGSLDSISRYYMVIFPITMTLAFLGSRYKRFSNYYLMLAFALQALLLMGWSQFYWIG